MNITVFNGAQNEDYNVIPRFSYLKPSVISSLVLGTKSSYSGPGGELENEKRKDWKESPCPFIIIRGFCYFFFFFAALLKVPTRMTFTRQQYDTER